MAKQLNPRGWRAANGPVDGSVSDVSAAKNFLSLWLANRRLQLAENAGGTREGARAAKSQNRNLWSVPAYSSVESMESGMGRYISSLRNRSANTTGPSSSMDAINADLTQRVLDQTRSVMQDPNMGGAYSTDGLGHRVAIARGTVDGPQSDMVHELAHSMEAKPQESKIADIMKGAKVDGGSNPYLESPTEIHSRLMQIRHDLNLDPRKNYTIDDVREMKNSSGKKYNFLDRYDDNTILRLLNEVASVSGPDTGVRNS